MPCRAISASSMCSAFSSTCCCCWDCSGPAIVYTTAQRLLAQTNAIKNKRRCCFFPQPNPHWFISTEIREHVEQRRASGRLKKKKKKRCAASAGSRRLCTSGMGTDVPVRLYHTALLQFTVSIVVVSSVKRRHAVICYQISHPSVFLQILRSVQQHPMHYITRLLCCSDSPT